MPAERTRPTSDRVREAVFSALESRMDISGAQVLDLYAGSGALGLEALSRGAAGALMVEADARAVRVIKSNVRAAGLAGARVRKATVAALLAGVPERRYDLVFADPPYAAPPEEVATMLSALVERGWLVPEALVVLERSARAAGTAWPDGFGEVTVRRYGETRIETGDCYGMAS